MKGFSSKRIALKAGVLRDRKIDCLLVRPCIFQPGNFTGSGSEGVNVSLSTVADVNEKMSTINGFDSERSL